MAEIGGPTAAAGASWRGWGESAADAAVTPGSRAFDSRAQPLVSPTANPVGTTARRFPSMYVPAPPAQPALALAPVGSPLSSDLRLLGPITPTVSTGLHVSSTSLDVLDGEPATVR